MKKFNAWLKAQSPAVQSFFYAVETGIATALAVFLWSVYTATQSAAGFTGFDWHAQTKVLAMGAIGAVCKAGFDYLKGNKPTQVTQGAQTP